MFSFLPRLPGRSKSTLVPIIGIATHTLKKKNQAYILLQFSWKQKFQVVQKFYVNSEICFLCKACVQKTYLQTI